MSEALALMTEHDIRHLPVVPAKDPRTLSGFVTRTDVMKAYVRRASQSGGKHCLTGNSTLIGPGAASENSTNGKKGSMVEG
ncbi:MAG: chloride channel protein family [Methanoculleus sp.]|nr:chloride channel protein family [Methanoculleus sp.]